MNRPHLLPRFRCVAPGLALALGGLLLPVSQTDAVILFATDNPAANTTEPVGDLAGSGWQFEGIFGAFLGTPIAPGFFITATHVSGASSTINFRGQDYPLIRSFNDPNTDLTIWQVGGTFPDFAPLYSRSDETGRPLVVIGRGTQRGGEITIGDEQKGWSWGNSDGVMRWGENVVAGVEQLGAGLGDTLYATFDQNGPPNEAHLSSGDSGGAVFIQDGGTWKLAGINYAVDDVFQSDGQGGYVRVIAALFDARGFYASENSNALISGSVPAPTGFYATRISSKLAWIYSVIDPTGSVSGDGVPNLLKYAMGMDPTVPSSAGTSQPGCEPGYSTITYKRQTAATDLSFSIERSTDLVTWTAASASDEILQTNGTIQTIISRVALDNEPQLFLRLRVTRP